MKILVVDDDVVCRSIMKALLERMGHQPTVVESGEAALSAYAAAFHPVIITDWLMAGIDGIELTRRIRARHERRYPWIMLLTVRDFGENYAATMELGIDDFLCKPIDAALLQARLLVAARVQSMIVRVGELESMLPICMHCKAIRNEENSWERLESYLHEHMSLGFSHGYCPDCFYDRELLPDLVRMRMLRENFRPWPARSSGGERGLSADAVEVLRAFAAQHSYSLVEDLVEMYQRAAGAEVAGLLDRLEAGGQMGAAAGKRLERFRQHCWDLGALRLHALLDPLELSARAHNPATRAAAVAEVRAELDIAGRAIGELVLHVRTAGAMH